MDHRFKVVWSFASSAVKHLNIVIILPIRIPWITTEKPPFKGRMGCGSLFPLHRRVANLSWLVLFWDDSFYYQCWGAKPLLWIFVVDVLTRSWKQRSTKESWNARDLENSSFVTPSFGTPHLFKEKPVYSFCIPWRIHGAGFFVPTDLPSKSTIYIHAEVNSSHRFMDPIDGSYTPLNFLYGFFAVSTGSTFGKRWHSPCRCGSRGPRWRIPCW